MADPVYCYPFKLLCHPLEWWSSAASWAQAILSAAAIYFAALAATAPEKLAKQRQAKSYLALFKLAKNAFSVCERLAATTIAASQLRPVADQFAAITVENIPDYRLVEPVRQVHHDLAIMLDFVESYVDGRTQGTQEQADNFLHKMASRHLADLEKREAVVKAVVTEIAPENVFTRLAKKIRRTK